MSKLTSDDDRKYAAERLKEIQEELDSLADEVETLVVHNFPEHENWARGYAVYTFGRSSNRYDQTFADLVNMATKDIDDEDDQDEDE
jgi:hypothetical protein